MNTWTDPDPPTSAMPALLALVLAIAWAFACSEGLR